MVENLTFVALILLVALAVGWDLRTRRIPNWLTVGATAVALALRATGGLEPFLLGTLGFAIGIAVSIPLVAAGGLGGGDAKLLAAVGAFLGPVHFIFAMLVTGVAGGLIAVAVAIKRGVFLETLDHTWGLIGRIVGLKPSKERRTLDTAGALTIPYAVPIAIGALVGWFA